MTNNPPTYVSNKFPEISCLRNNFSLPPAFRVSAKLFTTSLRGSGEPTANPATAIQCLTPAVRPSRQQ